MKKINSKKTSTEFGTYHEQENEISSNYDSLRDYSSKEESRTNEQNSSKKEECCEESCYSKRNKNLNR